MPKRQRDFHQRVAKQIDRRKFFGWAPGLMLPFAIGLSLFIGWHNSLIAQVQPVHLLLRAVIGFIGFGTIGIVVYVKAILPAVRKAQEEIEHVPTSDAR